MTAKGNDEGLVAACSGEGELTSPDKKRLTVTVDGAMCTRLLAVTLDFLAAAFVAGTCNSAAFLDGLRGSVGHLVLGFGGAAAEGHGIRVLPC